MRAHCCQSSKVLEVRRFEVYILGDSTVRNLRRVYLGRICVFESKTYLFLKNPSEVHIRFQIVVVSFEGNSEQLMRIGLGTEAGGTWDKRNI